MKRHLNPKIILINSPHFWLKTPHIGLEYLTQYLNQHNIPTEILDLNLSFFKQSGNSKTAWQNDNNINYFDNVLYKNILDCLIKRLKEEEIQIIGFSCFNTNWDFTIQLAGLIENKFPNKTIVFGGPQILFEYHKNELKEIKNTFKNAYFVIGEGFLPLLNIAQQNESNLPKDRVFKYNEIDNLEEIPICTFSHYDLDTFNFIPVLTHFGCSKRCIFCSECFLYKNVRSFPVDYIIEQLNFIKDNLNNKFISFQDSMFNLDLAYLDSLLSKMLERNITPFWEAQISVNNNMDINLLNKMKKSGCMNLFVGVESFSDRMLKQMNKGYTQDNCLQFFKKLKEADLFFEISLITGFPNESEEDFNETLSFIIKNKDLIPKIAQVNPFIPYPPSICVKNSSNLILNKDIGRQRLLKLLNTFEEHNIKYNKHFINNLITKP